MEIDKKKLKLLYKIEKSWPELWKWIQLQANKGFSLEEVIYVLERYWLQRNYVDNAWAYCTIALQKRMRRKQERQRESAWDETKKQEAGFAEKLAELIKGIGK